MHSIDNPPSAKNEAICPSTEILVLLGERWTARLIVALREAPRRNVELKKRVDGITSKELGKKLRMLEQNGLVVRHVESEERPRVTYALTPLGLTLESELQRLDGWVATNLAALITARSSFEKRLPVRNPWQVPRVS